MHLTKLDKVRAENRKKRLPQTLVCFKVFSGKTPKDLCRKLFWAYGNGLRFDFFPVQVHTRVDYDYSGLDLHSGECLVFFIFTGCVPPKIEIPNVLYVYRKGIDSDLFNSMLYENVIRFGGAYIQRLSFEDSREKVKGLGDFIQNKEKILQG